MNDILKVLEILLEIIRATFFLIIYYFLIKHKMPIIKHSNEISLFGGVMFALVMWGILDPITLGKSK